MKNCTQCGGLAPTLRSLGMELPLQIAPLSAFVRVERVLMKDGQCEGCGVPVGKWTRG